MVETEGSRTGIRLGVGMIVEDQEENLHEVDFIDPKLPGTKFLSITFTDADRTEFLGSSWKKVTNFEAACDKYLAMII